MVLGFEGEKCEICKKELVNEKTYKDVDMFGYTHNFCEKCYTDKEDEVEKILKRKKQGIKDIKY
ncbi:hypothetical protein KO317_01710 [Candidatus Micrarchaeota archaeon]|nr:hypothetical protein [Candidatus Micrarchaeota archaeon]